MIILNTLLNDLEINNNIILVGHSYGGLLIHLYSTLYAESVKGMLLIDPMNARVVGKIGLNRLLATVPSFDNPHTKREKALTRMSRHFSSLVETVKGMALDVETPIILITVGNPPYSFDPETVYSWRTSHEEMMSFSKRHLVVFLKDNSHDVVQENPAEIVKQLLRLTDSIRRG